MPDGFGALKCIFLGGLKAIEHLSTSLEQRVGAQQRIARKRGGWAGNRRVLGVGATGGECHTLPVDLGDDLPAAKQRVQVKIVFSAIVSKPAIIRVIAVAECPPARV